MTLFSSTRIALTAREVFPPGGSIAVSARYTVRVDEPEDKVDLTDALRRLVEGSGVAAGTLHVYCGHTSCGVAINERETGLWADLRGVLERVAPHTRDHYYAHDDLDIRTENLVPGERDNGHSHIRAWIATQPELSIPIVDNHLYLGRWQSIMLIEFDGPRSREVLARVHTANGALPAQRHTPNSGGGGPS